MNRVVTGADVETLQVVYDAQGKFSTIDLSEKGFLKLKYSCQTSSCDFDNYFRFSKV